MSLQIGMVTIDCADPQTLARFWAAALGTSVANDYGDFVMLAPNGSGAPALGLQRVPEPRTGKNRVHVDLGGGGGRAVEVDRLVGLGARVLDEQQMPGLAWTVLGDPEGNEFCVGEFMEQ